MKETYIGCATGVRRRAGGGLVPINTRLIDGRTVGADNDIAGIIHGETVELRCRVVDHYRCGGCICIDGFGVRIKHCDVCACDCAVVLPAEECILGRCAGHAHKRYTS